MKSTSALILTLTVLLVLFRQLNAPYPCLKIPYANARSILPKIDELRTVVSCDSPDIVCVVETWLSEEIANDEVVIEGYDCFRHDRNRQGGGVCIYTSKFLGGAQHLQLQMHFGIVICKC